MTNFRARPHFEDRQIQQSVGESITLSGQTNFDLGNYNGYVFDTYGGFITGVSGTTFLTLPFSASTDPLIGWDNQTMYQQSTLRLIPPRKVLFSGNTDTISSITQEDVTNYIITSVDSGGTLSWLPLSGLTSISCTPNLSVTTIQPCTSGGTVTMDGDFLVEGNFTVNGVVTSATTIIETEIVKVEDRNIELNYGGNHSTAVGGGITVLSGQSISLDSSIYTDTNGYWMFNPGLNSPTILSGATYLGDYSSTYTNRSLVDKEYVDLKVSGYTLEQTLTAGNTSGNNNILSPIGYGLVSQNTGTTAGYVFQSGRVTMYANDGILPFPTDDAYIDVLTNGSLGINATGGIDLVSNTVNVTGIGTFSGITYNADYSSNYINRSLVDKEYVDNTVSGVTYWDEDGTGNTALKDTKGTHTITGVSDNSILAGGNNSLISSINSAILGGENNILTSGNNTVILGGSGINGSSPDTVYMNNLSVQNTNGIFYSNVNGTTENSCVLSGSSNSLSFLESRTIDNSSVRFGVRGSAMSPFIFDEYGKTNDSFLYSSINNNGLNIISAPGISGTEDYIRFYAGQNAELANTPDIHIQGTGSTRGFVGIATENPTDTLHVNGSFRLQDGTEQNGYVLTSDANGVGTWQSQKVNTFTCFKQPEAIPLHSLTAKGIPEGTSISGYTTIYNNLTDISGTLTTDFGTFDNSTGLFTTNVDCVLKVSVWVHMKANTSSTTAWETGSTPTQIGVGVCPNNTTDIYTGNFITVLPSITRGMDVSTEVTSSYVSGSQFRVKILNQTSRAYPGSGTVSGDAVRFSITRLY